jgi:hypothetical protein
MPTIAKNGRWVIDVMYHEEVTLYSYWSRCMYILHQRLDYWKNCQHL